MTPEQLRYYGAAALSTLTFLSNVWFYNRIDYFNPRAAEDPLIHTWSLGIEEQFYIILPILLMIGLRFGAKVTFAMLAAVATTSFAWMLYSGQDLPMEAFYLLHTRAWELLAGVMVAMMRHRLLQLPVAMRGLLSSAGLVLVLTSLALTPAGVAWPGAWTLLPVLGTTLIVGTGDTNSPAKWLLSLRPVVAIGMISYSCYLWHQPLLGFLALEGWHPRSSQDLLLVLAVTLALAAVSWRFVEEPFRRKALSPKVGRGLLAAGICVRTAVRKSATVAAG